MREIWKFPLKPEIESIEMPADSEILTVQMQNGNPFIWALVYPNKKIFVLRRFKLFGTGHSILTTGEDEMTYINTFQMHNSSLVFHLFEIIKK